MNLDKIIECLRDTSLKDTQTTDKAFNNLIVLARDSSPETVYAHPDCFKIIGEYIEKSKQETGGGTQFVISCFRLLSELARMSVTRAKGILGHFPIDYLTDIIAYSNDNSLMTAYQYLVQTLLNTLAGVQEALNKLKKQAKLDKERTLTVSQSICNQVQKKVEDDMVKENEPLIMEILLRLIKRSSSHIISATARDTLLALVMSNIDYQGLNFGVQLVKEDCLQHLLDIASEVEELKSPSSMEISSMTHSLVAACLEKIFSCHDHDQVREKFRETTQEYLNKLLRNPDIDDKVRAAKIFTVLLAGPSEIGNSCIGQAGMIEMILAMASSDEYAQQKAALDAIIAAASKKDKCNAIANLGDKVLNELRESKNEEIRLRALVGLSKVSSVGSTDASIRPLTAEANPRYARDCRAIISRPTPEFTLKQYAIEALAYLSFDGTVKEELVEDRQALNALFETMTFDVNSPVVYSILNIFVNLTNSYDKQEQPPELVELAKFAQQHVPQEHPLDKHEIVKSRVEKLAISDLVTKLVQLANIESKAAKELIARIMNALAEVEHVRGRLVQQGAVTLLMALAQTDAKTPEKSCILATHALARLGITMDPQLVYQGQRLVAVIKPLKRLLKPECTALQNFEALLALTNIAQANETCRNHILNDNGFSLIESLMFEEHEMIRRAAVQCVVNLIREPQMVSLYEADNDRVKYLIILCQEEDLETVKAASGALAMLCQVSEKACEKIFEAKQWEEILMLLLSNENMELVHRAVVIVKCIVSCKDQKLAERIYASQISDVLMALTMPQLEGVPQPIKELASSIIKSNMANSTNEGSDSDDD
uniref:Protein unc-45 B n=1 Tax=Aceria tosichella TaxID=561515 RepID=A0A6G1SM34_9ACAR